MNKQFNFILAWILGMAALSIPSIASADATIQAVGATLVAKGSGANMSIQVTCDPSFGAQSIFSIQMTLTENIGKNVTTGSTGPAVGFGAPTVTINCDGSPHSLEFIVVAQGSDKPFKKGSGIAQAVFSLFSSDFSQSEFGSMPTQVVTIQ